MRREGAAPSRIQNTLFGQGGVQGLDDLEHRHRKALFVQLTTPEHANRIARIAEGWLLRYARRWCEQRQVVLYQQLPEVLTRTVCQWAGISLREDEVRCRSAQLTALFDDSGNFGPEHWWSRVNRIAANRWASQLVKRIRSGEMDLPPQAPAAIVAQHRDLAGDLLSSQAAGVELLNLLRPTVAVSVYLVFVAHALHRFADARRFVDSGTDTAVHSFVEEVRRYYPFFPFLAAIVRKSFQWHGFRFSRGRHVILDLYGINHDPRRWNDPNQFQAARFEHPGHCPFHSVPQGGGDVRTGHRCPGEPVALELMKMMTRFLNQSLTFQVPREQDLTVDYQRLPALPKSGFVMEEVHLRSNSSVFDHASAMTAGRH
ncbi:cytochrome P450 [Roseiconus nitratireducens]|nr:cytochrome P450 [Roseiconus nitratireducens]